jgi:curli biogenesis system outer membrane secretion channel CsgG
MGSCLTKDNKFVSDKYPQLGENKVVLSFNDPLACVHLMHFAEAHIEHGDKEFGHDLKTALTTHLVSTGEPE